MIINTMKPMDVISIKLSSGEEIVGLFVEKTNDYIKIRKPLALSITQNGPALTPYFMTGDVMGDAKEVAFNANLVTAMIKTYKPFADAYTQSTTGLDLSSPTVRNSGLVI